MGNVKILSAIADFLGLPVVFGLGNDNNIALCDYYETFIAKAITTKLQIN